MYINLKNPDMFIVRDNETFELWYSRVSDSIGRCIVCDKPKHLGCLSCLGDDCMKILDKSYQKIYYTIKSVGYNVYHS